MRKFHRPRGGLIRLVSCIVVSVGVTILGCSSNSSVPSAPLDAQAKEANIKQIQEGQPVSGGSGIKVQPKSIKAKVLGKAIQGN
jgi:hypothetical protein